MEQNSGTREAEALLERAYLQGLHFAYRPVFLAIVGVQFVQF